MIRKLFIYTSPHTDPYRNLAIEKALFDKADPESCILYLWQNQNTVVIGRNQNAWAECRLSLLEQEGGHLARRLSGGGAVFHDLGNLNFTFLMAEENYDLDTQLSVIREACSACGIATERSGRNDLLADGCKFSGNAFYHQGGHAYHHGTLLVDVDMDKLSRYLSPPKAKLEAKGITSVRSRVVNLSQLRPGLTCKQLAQQMHRSFEKVYGHCAQPVEFSPEELSTIDATTRLYGSWDWLYGPKLPFSFACEGHFPWGHIRLQLQAQSGFVTAAQVYTDAMDYTLSPLLEAALPGCRFQTEDLTQAIARAIPDAQVSADLGALLREQIL